MIEQIKALFRHPSAEELAVRQRMTTERELLDCEASLEYAVAMRDMLKIRLARLADTRERAL